MATGVMLAAVVSSAFGLMSLWLVLRFLWRVYDKGGANDLKAAAQALREARWRRSVDRSPRGSIRARHPKDEPPGRKSELT
jgi:hypothetical protein